MKMKILSLSHPISRLSCHSPVPDWVLFQNLTDNLPQLDGFPIGWRDEKKGTKCGIRSAEPLLKGQIWNFETGSGGICRFPFQNDPWGDVQSLFLVSIPSTDLKIVWSQLLELQRITCTGENIIVGSLGVSHSPAHLDSNFEPSRRMIERVFGSCIGDHHCPSEQWVYNCSITADVSAIFLPDWNAYWIEIQFPPLLLDSSENSEQSED